MKAPPSQEEVTQFEGQYVAQFLHAVRSDRSDEEQAEEDRKLAMKASEMVKPFMVHHTELSTIYETAQRLMAEGRHIDYTMFRSELKSMAGDGDETLATLEVLSEGLWTASALEEYAELVRREWRRRKFKELLAKSTESLTTDHREDGGRRLAMRLSLKAMEVYADSKGSGHLGYASSDEVIEVLAERAHSGEDSGISFPWRKLEGHCGPMIPGEVVAITAYSGGGKSTFASNLMDRLMLERHPCIAFPTEMHLQWMERLFAGRAGVPQKRAEKRQWRGAEDDLEKYMRVLHETKEAGEPWKIVPRGQITPQEIATSVRILRREWPGRTVVVFVDHMHRLDYGEEKADEAIGDATQMFKNMATDDSEGGLIFVLLFQPKKPDRENGEYSPTAGSRIRGHSSAWNEIDIHLCPFRAYVEVNRHQENQWGTKRTKLLQNGFPKIVRPSATKQDRKVDDEHFFVKVDKRRIGGEGPTLVLNFNPVSGKIWQKDSELDGMTERELGMLRRTDPQLAAEIEGDRS